MTWVGFPVAIVSALLVDPRPGCGDCATPAWCARTTQALNSRFPAGGARWRRQPSSPWRRSPSSTTAPTSTCSHQACGSGCPTCSGSPSLASSTIRWAGARRLPRRRGWRGHARALRAGSLSTGAVKALGALALAAYVVSGRGLESWRYLADVALLILATNLFNLLDLRPGRAEKALRAARRRPLPRRLDDGADRAARAVRRAGPGRRLASPCASGRCWATPAPTSSGPSPGVWLLIDARHPDARLIALVDRRRTDHLRGVAFDLGDDRLGSATALARLARQS